MRSSHSWQHWGTGDYGKWSKLSTERLLSHSYVEFKSVDLIGVGNGVVVIGSWWEGNEGPKIFINWY
jgi:hypothetical protein